MGCRAEVVDGEIVVELDGWDRLMTGRRRRSFPLADVIEASTVERGRLEPSIQHRSFGIGTHDGARRPGRRRVGSMLGRGVAGDQFWAVPAGAPNQELVVIDLAGPDIVRLVLAVDDPEALLTTIQAS